MDATPGGRSIRKISGLIVSNIIAQVLPVLVTPLISRIYTPAEVAIWGLFVTYVAFASVVSSLRYEVAIVSARDELDALCLAVGGSVLTIGTSILAGILLFGLIKFEFLGYELAPYWTVPATILGLVIASIAIILRYWYVRESSFKMVGATAIVRTGSQSLLQLTLGALRFGSVGLIVGEVGGRFTAILPMLKPFFAAAARLRPSLTISAIKESLQRHKAFPLYSAPSSALDALSGCLPLPMIADLYGASEAGQFLMAQRILAAPPALVGLSVGDVLHSEIGTDYRNGGRNMKKYFYKATLSLAALGFIPAVFTYFFGRWLFILLFGATWSIAGEMAQAMTIWVYSGFVVSPLSRVVFVLNGQKLKFLIDLASLLGTIVTLYYGRTHNWPVVSAVSLCSIVHAGTYVLYYGLLIRLIVRASPPPVPKVA